MRRSSPRQRGERSLLVLALAATLAGGCKPKPPPPRDAPESAPAARAPGSRQLGTSGIAPSVSASVRGPAARAPAVCTIIGKPLVWRYSPTLTPLPGGKLLLTGGRQRDGGDFLQECEILDLAAKSFTVTAPMKGSRAMHGAVALPDGKVLVVGGCDRMTGGKTPCEPLELYDPAAGKWSTVGKLPEGGTSHQLAALPGGRVLIAGGYRAGGSSDSIEDAFVWTPGSSKLVDAGSMPGGRWGADVFVGEAGSFLLARGNASTETMYDAATDTVREPAPVRFDEATGKLGPFAGTDETLTALAALPVRGETKLLRAEGKTLPALAYSPREVLAWDRAEKRWNAIFTFVRQHDAGAATVLEDGRAVVVGGLDPANGVAEICGP